MWSGGIRAFPSTSSLRLTRDRIFHPMSIKRQLYDRGMADKLKTRYVRSFLRDHVTLAIA